MPDRRQGERRESAILQKRIAISLSNFVYLCMIFVIIVAAIVACKIRYNRGYEDGYIEGYSVAYNDYVKENGDYSYEE